MSKDTPNTRGPYLSPGERLLLTPKELNRLADRLEQQPQEDPPPEATAWLRRNAVGYLTEEGAFLMLNQMVRAPTEEHIQELRKLAAQKQNDKDQFGIDWDTPHNKDSDAGLMKKTLR